MADSISGDFTSAGLLSMSHSETGRFVVAALDTDQVQLLRSGMESVRIVSPNLKNAGPFAAGRGVFTLSQSNRIGYLNAATGRSLGVPLQLPVGNAAQVAPFGDGILALLDDGAAYRWTPRQLRLEGAQPAPAAVGTPEWYGTPSHSSNGVELVEVDTGHWTVRREDDCEKSIRHPMPIDEFEAEAMAENIGLWPRTAAALSADGRVAVTAAANDHLIVWNAVDGKRLHGIERAGEHLYAHAVHVDLTGGRALVVFENAHQASTVALPVGRKIQDVTPDLSTALVSKGDRLWLLDPATGATKATVATDGRVLRAVFAADGERFAAASRNGLVYVWDTNSALPISDPLVFDRNPFKHLGAPCEDDYAWEQGELEFSPDGEQLAMRVSILSKSTSESNAPPRGRPPQVVQAPAQGTAQVPADESRWTQNLIVIRLPIMNCHDERRSADCDPF